MLTLLHGVGERFASGHGREGLGFEGEALGCSAAGGRERLASEASDPRRRRAGPCGLAVETSSALRMR